VLDVPIKEVQVLFGHQKQQRHALGSGLPWTLKWSLMGSMQKKEHVFICQGFINIQL
jgi:hypothetical protein